MYISIIQLLQYLQPRDIMKQTADRRNECGFPQKKVIIIESHDSDSATASGLDSCSPSVVVSVQV